MKIAFYAPLKSPEHTVPSGDRETARALLAALARAGHEPRLAARLRSRDGAGDPARQARIAALGNALASRFVAACRRDPARRPDLWFTYHLYYKAPDAIGPAVAAMLGIPYVVAEASVAAKRATGAWAVGHDAVVAALGRADAVIGLNPADRAGVVPHLRDPGRWVDLPPFIDGAPWRAAADRRAAHRARLGREMGLDPGQPWLVAVGMMRPGDKLASYRVLGAALATLLDLPWQLLVVGDGAARAEVDAALTPVGPRVFRAGALDRTAIAPLLAASDIMAWPAINEAFGVALIEAQAAGTPVVAGASGGVGGIVEDGVTGRLAPPGDAAAFAACVRGLLDDPAGRAAMGVAAGRRAARVHDIVPAAARLAEILRPLVPEAR